MASELTQVIVPKETVSDDVYRVTDIRYADGDSVNQGEIIGALETSKADFELEAPADGFIQYRVREGDDIAAGAVFAIISEQAGAKPPAPKGTNGKQSKSVKEATAPKVRISGRAEELMRDNGLTAEDFPNAVFIREKDVRDKLAAQKPTASAPKRRGPQRAAGTSVLIVGDKGHAGACLDLLLHRQELTCAGFIGTDDSPDEVYGYPVLGTNDDLPKLLERDGITKAVIGFGALANPIARKRVFDMLTDIGFELPTLIHPRAIVERSVVFGRGSQVFAGAIVGSNVNIADNCIINSGAIVSHDCVLHDNVHLTPGATLAGMVEIGENTVIGMNSNIYLGVAVGKNNLVSNGESIYKDIPDK